MTDLRGCRIPRFCRLSGHLRICFPRIYHLSPLREPPRHHYIYGGEHPKGVGQYGEQAISALLAGRIQLLSVDEQILKWLERLDLIDSYRLQADPDGEKNYEFRLKKYKDGPEVRPHRHRSGRFSNSTDFGTLLLRS